MTRTRQEWEREVRCYVAGGTAEFIDAIVGRLMRGPDCGVWHATHSAMATTRPCPCAPCVKVAGYH